MNIFRVATRSITISMQRFSSSQFGSNIGQSINANPIPFQQQNQYFLQDTLDLCLNKDQLQAKHQQLLTNLISNDKQAKQHFEEIQTDMKDLYSYIKTDILKEDDFPADSEFIKRAHYYFQSQGKKVRPVMVDMLANCLAKPSPQIQAKVRKWAALIEMMHIASLAHDDIIDDSPSRRGLESQHLKYGKKSAVFSANFIISKASRSIYDFNNLKLFEIYSMAMDHLATGEIIQMTTKSRRVNDDEHLFKQQVETYLHKSYYKTAALMANALRAVPVFFEGTTIEQEVASFRVGQHFGLAFQLVDDILDYTSTSQEMGKEALADIVDGNITGPVYFSRWTEKRQGKTEKFMLADLRNKNKTKEQAAQIKEWVMKNSGIELTFALAGMHIQRGVSFLDLLPQSDKPLWQYLGYKILSRNK